MKTQKLPPQTIQYLGHFLNFQVDKTHFWEFNHPCFPPVLHGLYRAGGVVEAGQLTARPDNVHQRRELVLVLPSRHQTWSIIISAV